MRVLFTHEGAQVLNIVQTQEGELSPFSVGIVRPSWLPPPCGSRGAPPFAYFMPGTRIALIANETKCRHSFFAGTPRGVAPRPLESSRHCADRHGQRRYTTSLSLDGCSPAEPPSVSRCAVEVTLLRLFASFLCSLVSFSFRSRSAWISGTRPAIMSRGVT